MHLVVLVPQIPEEVISVGCGMPLWFDSHFHFPTFNLYQVEHFVVAVCGIRISRQVWFETAQGCEAIFLILLRFTYRVFPIPSLVRGLKENPPSLQLGQCLEFWLSINDGSGG